MTTSILDNPQVSLISGLATYARLAPFHASEEYPEWPGSAVGPEENPAYGGVRLALYHLGLDSNRFDTAAWNPLAELISPGNTVVLKPNLVSHRNLGGRMYGVTDTDSLVTHGSIIRAVLDYAAKALQGAGRIIVCDCPVQGTDWQQVTELVGLDKTSEYFRERFPGICLELKDYRLGTAIRWRNTVVKRIINDEAMAEHQEVDIKCDSLLMDLMKGTYAFGVSEYPRGRMRAAHSPATNKYLYPKELLNADVMINLPKMKVHMKAGITCAMKNFVGTVGHKDYLPHFRFGDASEGGDEYPDLGAGWRTMWRLMHRAWDCEGGAMKLAYVALVRCIARVLRLDPRIPNPVWSLAAGSWHGNDTLWRTVLDINRAFLYFDPATGDVEPGAILRRRYLAILDGIVGGEQESPLAPSPNPAGVVMAAFNPLALDTAAAAVMGLDSGKIKQLSEAWRPMALPLAAFPKSAIQISGNTPAKSVAEVFSCGVARRFRPSRGFVGHIEAEPTSPPLVGGVRGGGDADYGA